MHMTNLTYLRFMEWEKSQEILMKMEKSTSFTWDSSKTDAFLFQIKGKDTHHTRTCSSRDVYNHNTVQRIRDRNICDQSRSLRIRWERNWKCIEFLFQIGISVPNKLREHKVRRISGKFPQQWLVRVLVRGTVPEVFISIMSSCFNCCFILGSVII